MRQDSLNFHPWQRELLKAIESGAELRPTLNRNRYGKSEIATLTVEAALRAGRTVVRHSDGITVIKRG